MNHSVTKLKVIGYIMPIVVNDCKLLLPGNIIYEHVCLPQA